MIPARANISTDKKATGFWLLHQVSEERGQRTENGGQRSEVRRQKSDDKDWKPDHLSDFCFLSSVICLLTPEPINPKYLNLAIYLPYSYIYP